MKKIFTKPSKRRKRVDDEALKAIAGASRVAAGMYDGIDFKPPAGAAKAAQKAASPLRAGPDYGEKGHRPQDYTEDELVEMAKKLAAAVNPYLNTPPTELRRDLESEGDPGKKKQMKDALNAWRVTTPGPFWRSQD